MATGHNTAAMESLQDAGKLGETTRFDVPEGMLSANPAVRAVESGVRNVARVSNKIAIDWEHNLAFTKFYQKAFYDMANIASTNIARSEGLTGEALKARAADIFRDASPCSLKPMLAHLSAWKPRNRAHVSLRPMIRWWHG